MKKANASSIYHCNLTLLVCFSTGNGVVRKLIDKQADIGLGSMSVMAERETVIDFTVPFYDLVGITIMMVMPSQVPSLFKFLTVLETNVWLCILAAYFFTR
jgi:glutamate receptor, ionotropic, invertebrate